MLRSNSYPCMKIYERNNNEYRPGRRKLIILNKLLEYGRHKTKSNDNLNKKSNPSKAMGLCWRSSITKNRQPESRKRTPPLATSIFGCHLSKRKELTHSMITKFQKNCWEWKLIIAQNLKRMKMKADSTKRRRIIKTNLNRPKEERSKLKI